MKVHPGKALLFGLVLLTGAGVNAMFNIEPSVVGPAFTVALLFLGVAVVVEYK